MTEHTDNGLNLGKFVLMIITRNDNRGNVLDRLVTALWWFIVPFFVILLILACSIVRITLAQNL